MEHTIKGQAYTLTAAAAGSVRLRAQGLKENGLDRYHVTSVPEDASMPAVELTEDGAIIRSEDGSVLTELTIRTGGDGWSAAFSLCEGEHLYGLGDVTRDRLDKRGYKCRMWVTNVKSYAPIPFLMSSRGWAVSFNTTFEHYVDAGAARADRLSVFSRYGAPDVTVYTGKDYAQLLERYTSFSGRPLMLPRWAMGLIFVCNENADVNVLIGDALNFRREGIPCDVLGLEPGWMEKNYDQSTSKSWNKARFPIPYWAPKGPSTFFGALERQHFKLSLWLCCNYDLSWYEEAQLGNAAEQRENTAASDSIGAFEDDEHFKNSAMYSDPDTKRDEGWFEHLKKFVDQGVSCFKLDGAYQVLDHPDRPWGNGMTDAEMHNLYPVIYAKQMSLGFSEHTGRRAMIYSAGGYTGVQKYAATWAGDTGGGFGPLVSMMNHGLSGHSNTSCDMDVFSTESIHFGFLQPWSQVNSWAYWRHPWLLEEQDKEIFRDYDRLRYSLAPYLYTAAYQAYACGMPMMRALPLIFPKDEKCADLLSEYMLGDSLLVGAFLTQAEHTGEAGGKVNFYLPDGGWFDFFTGDHYVGGREFFYNVPENKGGALFVREGSAIPFTDVRPALGDKPFGRVTVRAFGSPARGLLYSDDGVSLDYTRGAFSLSSLSVLNGSLSVSTVGSFPVPEIVLE